MPADNGATVAPGTAMAFPVANSILSVRNPTGNSTALTVTPLAGGNHPVSASLAIKQIG